VERQKVKDAEDSTPMVKKKKKRRHDKAAASSKSDMGSLAETDEAVKSVKVEPEFMPHDYGKANLNSLLQGTLCQKVLLILPHMFVYIQIWY